jgi:hypothetical protein
VLLGGALLACLFFVVALHDYGAMLAGNQYDDAYITYRYALNLASGNGYVFNVGERLNSASSTLFTLLLSAAWALHVRSLELVASILNLTAGAIMLIVLCLAAAEMSGSVFIALAVLAPLAVSGSLCGWAMSGMETIFFTALTASCLYAYFFRRHKVLAFVLLGLVLLCRPEGILLAGVIGLAELVHAVTHRTVSGLLRLVGLAVAPFALNVLAQAIYYGSPVPHAYRFKQVARYYHRSLRERFAFLADYHLLSFRFYLLFAAAAALIWLIRRRQTDSRTGYLSLYAVVVAVAVITGPYSDEARYAAFLLPPLALLAAGLLGDLARRFPNRSAPLLVAVGAAGLLLPGALANRARMIAFFDEGVSVQRARAVIGRWLERNTPPGDLIASSDVGAIGYYAPGRRFYDTYGLVSPDVLELVGTQPGRLFDRFIERRPRYIADTEVAGKLKSEEFPENPGSHYLGVPAIPKRTLSDHYRRFKELEMRVRTLGLVVYRLDWPKEP